MLALSSFSSPLVLAPALRRALGLLCFTLGMAGGALPILPGLPLLIVGARLLGPRDPLLRRLLVLARRILRLLRTAGHPLVRRLGAHLTLLWRCLAPLITGRRATALTLRAACGILAGR